jgi:hypothetical protein
MIKCEICGNAYSAYGIFSIHTHHWIKQQQIDKDPQWFEDNGLKQKTFSLCYRCHDLLHHSSEKTFLGDCGVKYKARTFKDITRYDFLWNRKEWLLQND